MRKNMRKWLSLILALTICLSLLPVGVLADEELEPAEEEKTTETEETEKPTETGEPAAEEEPAEAEEATELEKTAAEKAADAEITASGTYGSESDLTWTLDDSGTLTISGTGTITDCRSYYYSWYSRYESVISVVIESGVTSIGGYAFSGCSNLTSVTIPDSVTSIGCSAFSGCSSLTSAGPIGGDYNIQFGWTRKIPDYALYYCTSLTSVTIPDSVTSIGDSAFCCCTSLTSITIPGSVTSIGDYAFHGCSNLTDVYYAGSVNEWAAISMNSGNDTLTSATIHYNSTESSERELDVWSFSNSTPYFEQVSEGYYITSTDWNRLLSSEKLSAVDRACFGQYYVRFVPKHTVKKSAYNIDGNSELYDAWGGSCYGMSVWTCLNAAGTLAASDIDGTASSLHECSNSADAISAINYYQKQQSLTAVKQSFSKFMGYAQATQLEILEQLATDAANGGQPVSIGFQWYKNINNDGSCDESSGTGHAVVGYGIETGDYTDFVRGYMGDRTLDAEFTHKVLIYDCAYPDGGDAYCLYYSDGYIWCIPGWGIISLGSQSMDSKYNNGELIWVTSSTDLMNAIDYKTGEVSSVVADSASESRMIVWEPTGNSCFTVEWEVYSADIQGMSVSNNTSGQQINIAIDANITENGDTTDTEATAFLPVSESYTVTAENALAFQLNSGNYLTTAVTDVSGAVTFQADGGASVSADEAGAYYIGITANDDYTELPWSTVEIAGDNAQEISAILTDEGIVVTGDNLDNVTVYGYDSDGTADPESEELTFSTEYETVLIGAAEDDSLIVLADMDADGTYETPVGDQKDDPETGIPGDINGDGFVNNKDLNRLMKYLLNNSTVVVKEALDVNGDGSVNNKDLNRLMKYLLNNTTEIY